MLPILIAIDEKWYSDDINPEVWRLLGIAGYDSRIYTEDPYNKRTPNKGPTRTRLLGRVAHPTSLFEPLSGAAAARSALK